jgi:hypothetical protein
VFSNSLLIPAYARNIQEPHQATFPLFEQRFAIVIGIRKSVEPQSKVKNSINVFVYEQAFMRVKLTTIPT